MQRGSRVSLLVLLATLSVLFVGCESSLAPQPQPLLTAHVRDVTVNGQAKAVGVLPADQVMRIDVVLPLRNEADLQGFIQNVNDPSHPSYHRFLEPADFTAKYGPSKQDWDVLVAFAEAHGFQVTGGSLGARDLHLQGTVATIEQAFNVTLRLYQHPTESRTFYAPDREPTVALPLQLLHISGLDNYSIPHPMFHERTQSDPKPLATTGSGPSASYLGSDMRAAYYGNGSLTGTGQNIALLEYYGADLADLSTYYTNAHQTQPLTPTLISTDGTSTACVAPGCDDTEQTLDMTQALGMAPGISGLYVYVGSTDTAMISAMTTTADAPLSKQIGCSWGWTPADPSSLNGYWQTMAAQGQNFFVASGDNSTWKKTGSAAAWPADAAYVVTVGGTSLTTTGAGGAWSAETAWTHSGGGISPDSIAIPSWQTSAATTCKSAGLGCSTTLRNGPDVSANADYTFYVCAKQTTCTANSYGGTSFAAPMWAGYLALANQQATTNGDTIGFLNPLLYPAAEGSSYASLFHDVTSGTSGSFHAGTGFDLVTGWGSPKGSALITLLAPLPPGSQVSPSGSQSSASVPFTWTAVNGATSYALWVTADGTDTTYYQTYSPSTLGCASGTGDCITPSISSLPPGALAWYVDATVNGSAEPWVGPMSFTMPGNPPTQWAPSGTQSGPSVPFVWSAVPGAISYQLWVTADGINTTYSQSYLPGDVGCTSGTGDCTTPAIWLPTGALSWYIDATMGGSSQPWLGPMNFAIQGGSATQIAPTGNQSMSSLALSWTAVTGATGYQVWVTADGSNGVFDQTYLPSDVGCSSGTGTCTTAAASMPSGSVSWYVQTIVSGAPGPWVGPMNFATPVAEATLVSPSGTQGSDTVSFSWNAVSGATGYQVWVTADGTNGVFDPTYSSAAVSCSSGTGTCTTAAVSSLNSGTYSWYLQTEIRSASSGWNGPMSFTLP